MTALLEQIRDIIIENADGDVQNPTELAAQIRDVALTIHADMQKQIDVLTEELDAAEEAGCEVDNMILEHQREVEKLRDTVLTEAAKKASETALSIWQKAQGKSGSEHNQLLDMASGATTASQAIRAMKEG